jgi:hypothetical protein
MTVFDRTDRDDPMIYLGLMEDPKMEQVMVPPRLFLAAAGFVLVECAIFYVFWATVLNR